MIPKGIRKVRECRFRWLMVVLRERIGKIVEEERLPRIGRLVPMDLHAELLRRGKRRGSSCESETGPIEG